MKPARTGSGLRWCRPMSQRAAREILQNLAPPLIDHAASGGILTGMKQSSLDLNLSTKKTRKQELLA